MNETKLRNGDAVKEGDVVAFVNSDGEHCEGEIRKRQDGSLFFWNIDYEPSDYHSAFLVPPNDQAKARQTAPRST